MRQILVVFIVFILITMNLLSLFSGYTEGAILNQITDDNDAVSENILEIPDGGGKFILGNISIRKGVPVYDASFNLSVLSNGNGEYPSELELDVGDDYDNQYEFKGLGFGAMGQQRLFGGNQITERYEFLSGGSAGNILLRLPKNATVRSAEMQFRGTVYQMEDENKINITQGSIGGFHPADIDNDGDTDIVVTGSNEVVWYNNTNSDGSNWTQHKINASHNSVKWVHVFDVDNDGDMDVVAANPLIYYRNMDGKGRVWEFFNVNSSISPENIIIADMDNDGDGDIVGTTFSFYVGVTTIYWFKNIDKNGTTWETHSVTKNFPVVISITVADIDGDGDRDIIAGNTTTVHPSYRKTGGQINWFENKNGSFEWWLKGSLISKVWIKEQYEMPYPYSLETGDLDGDGDLDIVAGCASGIRWYQKPTDPKTIWNEYLIHSYGDWSSNVDVALGDIGNPGEPPDGLLDVVAINGEINGFDKSVMWWMNDGKPAKNGWEEEHYIERFKAVGSIVKLANIDNKNYLDIVIQNKAWYKLNGSLLSNVKLDIGADGTDEWVYPSGDFFGTIKIENLADVFNTLLESKPVSYSDSFGNDFIIINIKLSTDTPGRITFHDLNIEYNYTAKITGSSDKSLAEKLNEFMGMPGDGNVSIPIIIKSKTGGILKIDDIKINYNGYPESLPKGEFGIDEDTIDNYLIDLSKYFSDDYLDPIILTYEVISVTNSSIIDAFINDDHYLGVDAKTGETNDNWTGQTTIEIKASDNVGLETVSEPFTITIDPVNDEPVAGLKKLPGIIINEGEISNTIDLDSGKYFVDADSASLYFDFILDPDSEFVDKQLDVSIDSSTWILKVKAYNDWFTHPDESVTLRIFCDDDSTEINRSSAYQDIFITVNNLDDDPPVWSEIEDVYMYEDGVLNGAFNLHSYVNDTDNSPDDITFKILSVSDSRVHVDIDAQGDINILPDENYYGTVTVKLSATDGKNSGSTTFDIIVENVNDRPEVILQSPLSDAIIYSDTVKLEWVGFDADPPDITNLTYSIYLDTTGGTTLYQNYSSYKGTSLIISGLSDKIKYYWKVIPNDGIVEGSCVSEPCPASFTTDIGMIPHSILKLPANNAVVNKDFLLLIWDGYGEQSDTISYDIYFSNEPLIFPYPSLTLIRNDIFETKLLVEKLIPYTTYYWTVIPSSIRGEGACDSGIWAFYFDPTQASYELELEVPEDIRIRSGETFSTTVLIKNIGRNLDIVIPSLDEGMMEFAITLEGADSEFQLDRNGTIMLSLNISSQRLPVGSYDIIISARSLGSGDSRSKTISIEIYDPEHDEKAESAGQLIQNFLILIIVIIVVIAIVFFIFFQKKRNKQVEDEMARVEAEILGPALKQGLLEPAEVRYILGPKRRTEEALNGNRVLEYRKPAPKLPPGKDLDDDDTSDFENKKYDKLLSKDPEKDTVSDIASSSVEISRPDSITPDQLLEKLETQFKSGAISEGTYENLKRKYEERMNSRKNHQEIIVNDNSTDPENTG